MSMRILLGMLALMVVGLSAGAAESNRVVSATEAKRVTAVTAAGSTKRFYNANGSTAGRAQASGNTTHFYNANGASAGRASASGNSTQLYNPNGSVKGRVTK